MSLFEPVCPSPQTVYYLMKHKLSFSFHAHIFVLQNTNMIVKTQITRGSIIQYPPVSN